MSIRSYNPIVSCRESPSSWPPCRPGCYLGAADDVRAAFRGWDEAAPPYECSMSCLNVVVFSTLAQLLSSTVYRRRAELSQSTLSPTCRLYNKGRQHQRAGRTGGNCHQTSILSYGSAQPRKKQRLPKPFSTNDTSLRLYRPTVRPPLTTARSKAIIRVTMPS